MDNVEVHRFTCESCGRVDELTDQEAFDAGWDYPPFMGVWGIISQRTCPNCGIDTTVWWKIVTHEPLTQEDEEFARALSLETGPVVVGSRN